MADEIKLTFDDTDIREIRVDFEKPEMLQVFDELVLEPIKRVYGRIVVTTPDPACILIACPDGQGENIVNQIYRIVYTLAFISKELKGVTEPTEKILSELFEKAGNNLQGLGYKEINDLTAALGKEE